MKGDFTRDTFDGRKHYEQVLMQQGRVQLDADWNEQGAIAAYRTGHTASDIIGHCGGPADHAAFRCTMNPPAGSLPALAAGDFALSPGHYYVDGILCENESWTTYKTQPDRLDVPSLEQGSHYLVYLEVWQRHLTPLDDPAIRESALGGADTATRLKTVWQVRAKEVDALDASDPCGSDGPWWKTQTAPDESTLAASTTPGDLATDPCLVPAGSGYTGLENQLYRVEIHHPGGVIEADDLKNSAEVTLPAGEDKRIISVAFPSVQVGDFVEVFKKKEPMGGEIYMVMDVAGDDLTLSGEVTGLTDEDEPMLREVTRAEVATCKWSRENGAVVVGVTKFDNDKITVAGLVDDATLGFRVNGWAEITDDSHDLERTPGQLVRIKAINRQSGVITLHTSPVPVKDARHPKLRRWDGVMAAKKTALADQNWMPLEDGVRIQFSNTAAYRTAAYWQIPARAATASTRRGDIEWPRDSSVPGSLTWLAVRPRGTASHLCRLGTIKDFGGAGMKLTDCRCLFPALSAVPRLFYLGGDGQEVMPDFRQGADPNELYPLPSPLVAGVANGSCLPPGTKVRFRVLPNGAPGRLEAPGVGRNDVIDVTINANGRAEAWFLLSRTLDVQRVSAALVDVLDQEVEPFIFFTARLSVASQVAYNGANCTALQSKRSVQEALAQIASQQRIEMIAGDGQVTPPGAELPLPLQVALTSGCAPVVGAVIIFKATGGKLAESKNGSIAGTPTLEVPTKANGVASVFWTPDPAGPAVQQLEAVVKNPAPAGSPGALENPAPAVFTANLLQGKGSSCCRTVGLLKEGADFESLADAVRTLLEKEKRTDFCICLMPGNHVLKDPLLIVPLDDKQPVHIAIHGHGPGSRLHVQNRGSLHFEKLESLSLRDFSLLAEDAPAPLRITNCQSVEIDNCNFSSRFNLVRLVEVRAVRRLRIIDCRLESALDFARADAGKPFTLREKLTDAERAETPDALSQTAKFAGVAEQLARSAPDEYAKAVDFFSKPSIKATFLIPDEVARRYDDAVAKLSLAKDPPGPGDQEKGWELPANNRQVLIRGAIERLAFGEALVLADIAGSDEYRLEELVLRGNSFIGTVVVFGSKGEASPGSLRKLIESVEKDTIKFGKPFGAWEIQENSFYRITVSQEFASGFDGVSAIDLQNAPLHVDCRGNAFHGTETWLHSGASPSVIFLSHRLDFSHNVFQLHGFTGAGVIGLFFCRSGVVVGNQARENAEFFLLARHQSNLIHNLLNIIRVKVLP